MAFSGSCHCGKISFDAMDDPQDALSCNCSICRRKGSLLHFLSPERVQIHASAGDTLVYTFNSHVIRHHFCKTCGCAPYAEGLTPAGTPIIAINLRCADGIDLAQLKIKEFDGATLR